MSDERFFKEAEQLLYDEFQYVLKLHSKDDLMKYILARIERKNYYLSTDPENIVGKHVYEKIGFAAENKMLDDEELYKYVY